MLRQQQPQAVCRDGAPFAIPAIADCGAFAVIQVTSDGLVSAANAVLARLLGEDGADAVAQRPVHSILARGEDGRLLSFPRPTPRRGATSKCI